MSSNKYKRDDYGNRMKSYENIGNNLKLIANLPVIIRLDGNKFSTLSKLLKLEKPFDQKFTDVMQKTTEFLIKNNPKCVLAYTQSDEITLVFKDTYEDPVDFDRRIQKICSITASKCSVYFNKLLKEAFPENDQIGTEIFPVFDSRVFNVPNWTEVSNSVLWRESDATKNSIQSAGQELLGHQEIQGLSNKAVQKKLLLTANTNWNDYPDHFKKGSYYVRVQSKDYPERTVINSDVKIPPLNTLTNNERLSLLFPLLGF